MGFKIQNILFPVWIWVLKFKIFYFGVGDNDAAVAQVFKI
jgi:hypothetical protein